MRKSVIGIAALLVAGATFSACQSQEDAVKKSENEVFAIHDEVMPKIDDMMKLSKQLTVRAASLDSLRAVSSGTAALRATEEREQVMRIGRGLVVADSLMTNWMTKYNGDTLAKLPPDDALRYLAAQKDQITDVRTKFKTSIEQARQFLGNL